jgi:hypothetical protein
MQAWSFLDDREVRNQHDVQRDATGREDRAWEQAPAALELGKCRRISKQW